MYYFLAFLSGIIITVQLITNARLSKTVGMIKATYINFLVAVIILGIQVTFIKNLINFDKLPFVPAIYYLGGFLAIIITIASNFLIPKLPLIYSTIFTFLGQMITSLIIDYFIGFRFSLTKISGFVLVVIGIFSIIYIDYKSLTTGKGTSANS